MITCCQCVFVVLTVVSVATGDTTPIIRRHQPDTCSQLLSSPLQAIATSTSQLASDIQDIRETMGNMDQTMGNMEQTMGNMEGTMRAMHTLMRGSRYFHGRILERDDTLLPRHCQDLLEQGDSGRGVRQVYPYPGRPSDVVDVYCDQVTDGGGWLVFQRRLNLTTRENFTRSWLEYELGFGNLNGEFWAGLDILNVLTSSSLQQLRVELSDWEGGNGWAKYGVFNVGPGTDKYRLTIDRYSGDVGDSMTEKHNGRQFSTYDAETDEGGSCAKKYKGGWWYGSCHEANPNGLPLQAEQESYADGINWYHWKGYQYSLRTTTFMIKPALSK
ncbi:hypothetical protein Pmani_038261 [Petrolisthes manimaculis]|uniref:Fibrinogen C-terminal domain-containing protein n=1 Tax=Petrolisthes manimaculis TaxID=1843537 RepID=A0AAE1NG41_9EUCA|nr:hypothetical protein Pmani_038261 [Petrolisthes manimaculis]